MARAGTIPAMPGAPARTDAASRLAAVAIDKPQQPGKRIGRSRGGGFRFGRRGERRIVDRYVGAARKGRQREREFLRDRLADIDRIPVERPERDILADQAGGVLLGVRWAVEQLESLVEDPGNRIERHDAALLEHRLKIRAQQDHPFAPGNHPGDQFDIGLEPVQRYQLEAPGQRHAFLLAGVDAVAVRVGADPGQRYAPREFGGAAHDCMTPSGCTAAPAGITDDSTETAGSPNAMSPASSASVPCRRSAAAWPRT